MIRPGDLVLTGVPRSGTTLSCHLLNSLPDTVALHEPMPMRRLSRLDRVTRPQAIEDFFDAMRASLIANGTARTKHEDGLVPENPIAPREVGSRSPRKVVVAGGWARFDKPLGRDFLLCIKHNAGFAAILEELTPRFSCLAIVRNPLAVLASWCSVDLRVREGRVPAAERFDAGLAATLDSLGGVLERQLHVLDWLFQRFASCLPRERIVRYEDVIATGGRALAIAAPAAADLDRVLSNRNRNREYDHELLGLLGRAVLERDDASWWEFYDREDVSRIIDGPSPLTRGATP